MAGRFHACKECAFLVEAGSAHCPNCGLVFREAGFLDRIFNRRPERHPENYRSLETRLGAEIARLEANANEYRGKLAPLTQRVAEARSAGRDPKALEAALIELQQAVTDSLMLIQKHRALLTGIEIERRHNRIRVFLDDLSQTGSSLARLSDGGEPTAKHAVSGTVRRLAWTPDGALLAVIGQDLCRVGDAVVVLSPIANGRIGGFALSRDGRFVALGVGASVQIYDLNLSVWLPPASPRGDAGQVTAIGFAPDGRWLVVGTDRGQLSRFTLAADPSVFPPHEAHVERSAHAGAITTAAVTQDSRRVVSVGGGSAVNWWLMGEKLSQFSSRALPDARDVAFADDGTRVAVARGPKVEVWDLGVTALEGAIDVGQAVNGIEFSPDGFRILAWTSRAVLACSPASRSAVPLVEAGVLQAVALPTTGLSVAYAVATGSGAELVIRDLGRAGLSGWTLAALAEVRRAMKSAGGLSESGGGPAAAALRSQTRALVRDAGMSAVLAVTKRVEVVENAAKESGDPDAIIPHLKALFTELADVDEVLRDAAKRAQPLNEQAEKLRRLPIAVLLSQADAVVGQIESIFRKASRGDEADVARALERLGQLRAYVRRLQDLSNTLPGPFWGSPDRPKLNDLLQHLTESMPGIEDSLVARQATAAVGRSDALQDDVLLDNLRARQDRIRRGDGSHGEAADASVLLDEIVAGGTIDDEDAERERRAALDHMESARRDLNAETEAFLETHRLDD